MKSHGTQPTGSFLTRALVVAGSAQSISPQPRSTRRLLFVSILLQALTAEGVQLSKLDKRSRLLANIRTSCNESGAAFDARSCFEHTLGGTREDIFNNSAGVNVQPISKAPADAQCTRSFYQYTFDEFEDRFPQLKRCLLTTYALIVESAAKEASSCRAQRPEDADVLMVAPYLALECNWPSYGGGNCHSSANYYRPGRICYGQEVISAVAELQAIYPHKSVLLIEQNPLFSTYPLNKKEYAEPNRIWAKVNSLNAFYRPGQDISMPPVATKRCEHVPARAFDEELSAKRYFLSFKGQTERGPVRSKVLHLFNNGADQVVVKGDNRDYDMDELMQSSRFNLILGGDVEFSYRFNEAVCSGGVPVLVTERWVPPFSEFLPFGFSFVRAMSRILSRR